MSDLQNAPTGFLEKVDRFIEENLGDERYGVSELADSMGMSRSSLLRNIKKDTKLSASQYVRQVRLKHGMVMLQKSSMTVSEVSHQVGFNSPSYFVKCFREHYGYPPGEVGKRDINQEVEDRVEESRSKKPFAIVVVVVLIALLLTYLVVQPGASEPAHTKQSIAVLPFVNNSNDSSNVYFINGLMESILNNLQRIEDLKVVSRTSVEKYRDGSRSMPEIADELGVNYLIEGSGQKIGDQIMLHIQLIEGETDNHIWAEEYVRQVEDVFALQGEVSKKIADEIQVVITPEVEIQIDKVPTTNMEAYDLYLQGINQFDWRNQESLEYAVSLFKQAIEKDENFAEAYGSIATSYYLMDMMQSNKKYREDINFYSDKAMLLDPELPQSLIAKSHYYMHGGEYKLAEPYLLKAYKLQPNAAWVVNLLSDFYTNYSPNTKQYLKFALKGAQLNVGANDSVNASFIYLHLSNALIQSGFVDEAIFNINKSLDYNPENPYSRYLRAFMYYPKSNDIDLTKRMLMEEYQKDSSRMDILQDLARVYYYKRDFDSAYVHYNTFLNFRESQQLDYFRHQNAIIGEVMLRVGQRERGEALFEDYRQWAETDQSIYRELALAMYHVHKEEYEIAFEKVRKFAEGDEYFYWVVLFFREDPLVDKIKDHPEFIEVAEKIEMKFWDRHKEIRVSLEEEGLLLE